MELNLALYGPSLGLNSVSVVRYDMAVKYGNWAMAFEGYFVDANRVIDLSLRT